MKKHRVLIGAAGTGTCFGSVTALRRTWGNEIAIVTMDINPRHLVTASLLSDQYVQVAPTVLAEFADQVLEIMRRHDIDTYLPLLPLEIAIAAQLKESGKMGKATQLLTPSLFAAAACSNKLVLCELLEKNHIPVPRYSAVPPSFAADYYFVKPKDGVGSKEARQVSAEELDYFPPEEQANLIAQEICALPEVTVDCFFDKRKDVAHAICRERVEVKTGVATKCRLFGDILLTQCARQIAQALDLSGTFCFQVMKNSSDDWVVTDVNPRPGAGTAMCWTTGNDFISAGFAYCWGEDTERFFQTMTNEVYVTRQYTDFLMGAVA